jgi:hypothetical protein
MGPVLVDPKNRKVDPGVGPGLAVSPLQENAHGGVQGEAGSSRNYVIRGPRSSSVWLPENLSVSNHLDRQAAIQS